MPERISDKGFKWLTLYTLALAGFPSYARAVIESLSAKYWSSGDQLIDCVIVLAIAFSSFVFLIRAIVKMLSVVHVAPKDVFDFRPPLEEIWKQRDVAEHVLLYVVAKEYSDASERNLQRSADRISKMRSSYHSFYVALSVGIALYLFAKIQFYYYNGSW